MHIGRKIGIIIITAYCFSAVFSCRTERIPAFSVLDNDVEHLMREYIAAHPNYDVFILYTPKLQHYDRQQLLQPGLVFSQFTAGMIRDVVILSYAFCIKMDGKQIYVTSYPKYAIDYVPRIKRDTAAVIDMHPPYIELDTIISTSQKGSFSLRPVISYVPGIYFEYRDGKICNISNRPDTVLHGNPYPEIPASICQDRLDIPMYKGNREDSDYEVIRAKMKIHPILQDSIEREMARHPECNTFVLVQAPRFTPTGEIRDAPEYLFGPASDSILNHRNLDCYQEFGDKRVFLLSEIFDVFESEPSRWKNRNPKDSVVLDDGTVVKDSWDLFLLRSTLYSVGSYNIHVNNRPDTLFLFGNPTAKQ